jgi:hypothetical protein
LRRRDSSGGSEKGGNRGCFLTNTALELAAHVNTAKTASALLASLIGISVLARSRPERSLLMDIVDDAVRRLE